MPTVSDYLEVVKSGVYAPQTNTWVRLVNNSTSTAYVSTAATGGSGIWTISNLPAGSYTVYTGPSSTGPWTSAGNANYLIAPANLGFYNVMDYGVKGDGVTDDSMAIQNALNAANTAGGGTVYFPAATYAVASALSVNDMNNLILQGGGGTSTGTTGGAILNYTGTTGSLLTLNSAGGISVRDLKFWQSQSSYNGNLVSTDWSGANRDPAYIYFERCTFIGVSGGSCRSLLRLNRCIVSGAEKCHFLYGTYGILGRDTNYSNVIRVKDCSFNYQGTASIYNAGEDWLIDGNTFEPLAAGTCGAYGQDANFCYALTFQNNWLGDVSAAGGTAFAAKVLGCAVINNRFAISGASSTAVSLVAGCQGVTIVGNRFEAVTGITIAATTFGLLVASNDIYNTTTPISGATNALARSIFGNYYTGAVDDSSNPAIFRQTVTTAASVIGAAGLNVPHGTAPTSPNNGDVWTTSSGMFVRINGVTKSVNLT